MTTLILGLTGKAHAGKDTVASHLCRAYAFRRLAFADPLKDSAAALFGLPRDHFENPALKEERNRQWGLSPRQMLQFLGTDLVRRNLGEDFWLQRMDFELQSLLWVSRVVISDVRYENEASFVRRLGGIVIHVSRPGAGLDGDTGKHASEAGIVFKGRDHLISNDGSLADLSAKIDACISTILSERSSA